MAGDPKNNYSSNEDINLHLRGNPTFLGIEHKILAAAEILKSTNIFAGPDVVNGFSPGGQYLDINPINPVYQSTFVAPVSPSSPDGPAPLNGNTSKADSGYINDLMSIGGHFKVLVAARYDGLTTTAFGEQSPVPTNIMNHKISPSVGVVWQPNDSTSIYANYATSFVPSFGRNKENDVLKPEQSTSYEVGIKLEAFDRRLAVTAAVFEIKKRNIVESDPTDINYQENGGDAQSDGFEIEFEAKPSSTLALHGGVAYADARITSSTDYPAGSKLVGPYPWTAELYARQDLRDLDLEHAWVSGNFFYGSARANYAPSDGETIPATYRFDLAAGKTFGHFGIQANLKNVLDKKSFLSNGGGIVFYDTPRSLGATLTYSF